MGIVKAATNFDCLMPDTIANESNGSRPEGEALAVKTMNDEIVKRRGADTYGKKRVYDKKNYENYCFTSEI